MSKYDPLAIRRMARVALESRCSGSPRWFRLVLQLCVITGLGAQAVEVKIEGLARGVDTHA